jgi:hypothetical protein
VERSFDLGRPVFMNELDQIGGIGPVENLDDRAAFAPGQTKSRMGAANVDYLQQFEARPVRRTPPSAII